MNPDLLSDAPPPEPQPASRLPLLLTILFALIFVLVLPYTVEQVQYGLVRGALRARADAATEELSELARNAELVTLSDTSRAFRAVARKLEPSVVHIEIEQVTDRDGRALFDEFGFRPSEDGFAYRAQGQGSGVVVDPAGYIVTNFHVIQGATAIRVRLADGRSTDRVTVIGDDVLTDLAVLKVDLGGLMAASWGDSDQLEVGDWVLAVGNPFGLDRTVTVGIVSAKQRRGVGAGTVYQDFLQTDAAVNPGNSGGPLVNVKGEIVGINTAIVGQSYRGVSFAIPSTLARGVVQRLIEDGEVARGWLGVGLQDLSQEIATQLGLPDTNGALIAGVQRGSPAEAAGLQPGDIVVEWDGHPIKERTELTLLVARTPIGKSVKAGVIRNGERIDIEVTVGRRPDERELRQGR